MLFRSIAEDAGALATAGYGTALGVPQLNCLAGKAPAGAADAELRRTYVANLRYTAAALKEVGSDNLFLQYDIYHAQRMEGELGNTLTKHLAQIGHIQLADNPGRGEPGTGEINYPFVLDAIDRKSTRLNSSHIEPSRMPSSA